MNKPQILPLPLTNSEQSEFNKLKENLFKGDMFVVFDKKTLDSPEMARYDELMCKKMEHLAFEHYQSVNN